MTPETDLNELDIDARYLNPLASHRLLTIGSVLAIVKDNPRNLLKLSGVGERTVTEVLSAIADAGFDVPQLQKQPERTPDDDELADIVIADVRADTCFFHGAWHRYQAGLWSEIKSIYPQVIQVLRDNRWRGVRPSRARVSSVEFFVQAELEIEDDSQVDAYPQYFNVENGLFNLDTMQLEAHRKDVYLTAQAGFAYDPDADAPIFRQWLAQMLVHESTAKTDFSLVHLVQEMMGYCLTADTSHRVSFWIVGASGTGKSTLVNLMIQMAKSYHTTIDLNQLASNRFLLSKVAGKRLVTSVEASAGVRLEDGIYKTLVSDDVVLADVKNRDPIEFVPQCKIVWAMNNLPYVGDRSGAMDSRVLIIPMTHQIGRSEWDLNLDEKLSSELAGIFNFALEGLQRLRRNGAFTEVEQSVRMSHDYRKMQDIYVAFLEDEDWCVLAASERCEPTVLYKAFGAWCSENGIRNYASKISIAREWERLGLERGKSNNKRYYKGVGLSDAVTRRVLWD